MELEKRNKRRSVLTLCHDFHFTNFKEEAKAYHTGTEHFVECSEPFEKTYRLLKEAPTAELESGWLDPEKHDPVYIALRNLSEDVVVQLTSGDAHISFVPPKGSVGIFIPKLDHSIEALFLQGSRSDLVKVQYHLITTEKLREDG